MFLSLLKVLSIPWIQNPVYIIIIVQLPAYKKDRWFRSWVIQNQSRQTQKLGDHLTLKLFEIANDPHTKRIVIIKVIEIEWSIFMCLTFRCTLLQLFKCFNTLVSNVLKIVRSISTFVLKILNDTRSFLDIQYFILN